VAATYRQRQGLYVGSVDIARLSGQTQGRRQSIIATLYVLCRITWAKGLCLLCRWIWIKCARSATMFEDLRRQGTLTFDVGQDVGADIC